MRKPFWARNRSRGRQPVLVEQPRKQVAKRKRVKAPRVKGPSYYAYKPDALILASFASLAEIETASIEPRPVVGEPSSFSRGRIHLASLKLRMTKEVAKAVKGHYAENPEFIWITDGAINTKAREAMSVLASAEAVGLNSAHYKVATPNGGGRLSDETIWQEELMRFEIELSAKVVTYALDAMRGRIDPNRISGYHDLPRKKIDQKGILRVVATFDDVGEYLDGLSPNSTQFKALAAALEDLRSKDDTIEVVEIKAGTFIKPGRTHPELPNVIAAMRLSASDTLKSDHAETLAAYDGGEVFTPELVKMTRDFQRERGLLADGIVGKNTIAAMTPVTNRDRIRKVEFAMERLRWLPRQLGNKHVFINQPAFTASYVSDGREQLSMRVVVGKKANQTSFFSDQIERVEFNPYWGVPRSIIVNEMVPKLRRDPSYLDRLGYEVSNVKGRRVSSRSVDWYGVASGRVPINVRQPPGRKNALGELKILFPNKHAIYMHDTPQKHLFERNKRAFSHGCVRLHDPRAMAAAVLGKSKEYVGSRIAEGKNDADEIDVNIPVHVAYFTAWPKADGSIGYYDDTYDRDKRLQKAIEATDRVRKTKS